MKDYIFGELSGTFVMVLIGCGSVGYSLVYPDFTLIYISLSWALGVFLGIIIGSRKSHAHLNPAVSLAFLLKKKIDFKRFLIESSAQFIGALLAAVLLFFLFDSSLEVLESAKGWSRHDETGLNTAKMFGEYFSEDVVSMPIAAFMEGFGTLLLVLMIFKLGAKYNTRPFLTALFIGLSVAIIITAIAPATQCGINPARDLGPRIVAFCAGWEHAFDLPNFGSIAVYVLSPLCGGALAVPIGRFI